MIKLERKNIYFIKLKLIGNNIVKITKLSNFPEYNLFPVMHVMGNKLLIISISKYKVKGEMNYLIIVKSFHYIEI